MRKSAQSNRSSTEVDMYFTFWRSGRTRWAQDGPTVLEVVSSVGRKHRRFPLEPANVSNATWLYAKERSAAEELNETLLDHDQIVS